MKKSDITRTVFDIKFLTFFFLVLSFLPFEATCVPGNLLLFASPFLIIFARYYYTRRITRDDLMHAGIFVVAVLFITLLASMTNCVKTYGVAQEVLPEWKAAHIDSISSDGIVFIKTIKTIPVPLSEIHIFVDGAPRKCQWANSYLNFIAPGEIRACSAGVVCTGSTLVEITTPGNNDTATC